MSALPNKEVMCAEYRAFIGDKNINKFMAAMDLGTFGAYVPHVVTISWKAGERVTKKRATELCKKIKEGLNIDKSVDCASVEFLRLYIK